MEKKYEILCEKMIEEQLKRRNIKSEAVLDAMRKVPRHLFVPESLQSNAYDDSPLPIGLGQTISQPYIVAFMTEQLDAAPGMKILEIGTGSGYQAAVLAFLGFEVCTLELFEEHTIRAKEILSGLNLHNIKVKCGNGYSGWPEEAPFDAIIVTAAPERIPEKLIEQLKENGKMILPVGETNQVQLLKLVIKRDAGIMVKEFFPVRFVPMLE